MRFPSRSPLGNSPECIHQAAGTVGKFVGKPPLLAERRMRPCWQSLKIGHPIEGSHRFFAIRFVSSACKVQRFDRSQPGRVTVATLIRFIAAKIRAVPLLGRHQCSVNAILRPLRSRFHPFNQSPGVRLPVRVFFGMQQNVARKFQRNHIVHVDHGGRNVLEVANPDVILQRIGREPLPRGLAHFGILGEIALLQADQFIEQRYRPKNIGRVGAHALAFDAAVARVTAHGPGRMEIVSGFVISYEFIGKVNRGVQVLLLSRHFVEPHIGVAIFSNQVRFHVVFAVAAPAGVMLRSRIRRWIRHSRPLVTRGRQPVGHLVVDKLLQVGQRAPVAGVGIQTLDKTFQHCTQIGGGIGPVLVGDQLARGRINRKTAIVVRKTLALKLVLKNRPLRHEMRGVRVADGIREGPRQQFALTVE